ncbi:MAG: hypothetical protein WD826_10310 [Actinomycetota bacterium]
MPDAPIDAETLERELERLPEVRAARVVSSPSGRILEIHLVTDGTKAPKQLTRDVETVAATRGLDIDRRTISIAQMPEATDPSVAQHVRLASISVAVESGLATCRVRVTRGDEDAIGEASAAATAAGRPRLVATATIDAVSSVLGSRLAAACDDVRITELGGREIAVAVLTFVVDGDESVEPGVHPVRADPDDAVARAVLDAINRHHGV